MGTPVLVFKPKMKVLLLVAVLAVSAYALPSYKSQFEAFQFEHGKSYKSSAERLQRFANFVRNVREIEEHNRSNKSWKKSLNRFADMSHEEFNQIMNGYITMPSPAGAMAAPKDINIKDLPASIPQLGMVYTQLFGLTMEADYPYTSGNSGSTGSCNYDANSMDAPATLRGYELLPRNNYEAVMNHLANVGPLSVAVDASKWSFYSGGIF